MWRECSAGDFTLATNALAREYVRHEGIALILRIIYFRDIAYDESPAVTLLKISF